MTDEEYTLEKKPDAHVRWKQSERPSCCIEDGHGHLLGISENDFPARSYEEIIADAWRASAEKLRGVVPNR